MKDSKQMTLDEKLKEKLKALVYDEWDYEDFLKEGLESYASSIKQAFEDEGYAKTPIITSETKSIYAPVVGDETRTFRTGQDWYNRFERELQHKTIRVEQGESEANAIADFCKNIAKKASGITND